LATPPESALENRRRTDGSGDADDTPIHTTQHPPKRAPTLAVNPTEFELTESDRSRTIARAASCRWKDLQMFRRPFVVLCATVFAGCTAVAVRDMDTLYGPEQVRDRIATSADAVDFEHTVQPIFDRRCLVCHACYDAPCQLKMENFSGIDRGASTVAVYDSARLLEAPPTRLGIDAQTTQQWREKDFHPVLNERDQTPQHNLNASVLYNMLVLKASNPLPSGVLPDGMFDFSIGRAQSCTTLEGMPKYAHEHPQWGMPFGMPALSSAEMSSVTKWLSAGAKTRSPPPMAAAYQQSVDTWEKFFNGASPKEQLMSRYMFEHLFLADIYFDEVGTEEHFRLVRSRTPPGEPIDLIATRRPYDDPGVSRPFYRLEWSNQTLVSKTHMAYALDAKRMRRWRALFLEPEYTVDRLPDYKRADASNPFVTFRSIPVKSRYQFMIDEAQFTIMGFIKGPVCRGQIALDVIDDQFWVWFIDPDVEAKTHDGEFLATHFSDLELPASDGSTILRPLQWRHFAKLEKTYLAAKAQHLLETYPNGRKLTVDLIRDGDGTNQNAALTVFRHFDSASVVKGLVGAEPKTAWVIDYPLLERIHYLLVAGYDVFGNAGLQLFSRLYMDFLRIGGEFNFLYFLPPDARAAAIDVWYRGAEQTIAVFLKDYQDLFNEDTGIAYAGGDPQTELYQHLRTRVAPVLSHYYDLERAALAAPLGQELARLATISGVPVSWLPELSILTVETDRGPLAFTLVHNDAHTNVASMFHEMRRRLPDEDTLTVVPGFLGAYPNALFKVQQRDLDRFVDGVAGLKSEADFGALMDQFGVRRSDPNFWTHSDMIFTQVQALDYPNTGVLDYSRIENR
jgi:Fatty acid cis/trans isomerase (CTI)